MENAIKIAAAIIDQLPKDKLCPETTSDNGRFCSFLPLLVVLMEQVIVKFIIRDFVTDGLKEKEDLLKYTEKVYEKLS